MLVNPARTPRGARLGPVAGQPRGRRGRLAAGGWHRADLGGRAAGGDRDRPGYRRAGQHHVGEQRGGHDPAGGRTGGGGGGVRDPVPHRRGAGCRAGAGAVLPTAARTRSPSPGTSSAARWVRVRCCWPGGPSRCRCCTVAGRRATSGRARSTPRRSAGSRPRRRSWRRAGKRRRSGWRRCATTWPPGCCRGARRHPQRRAARPGAAAGERALLLPRLRGGCPAHAARRQGDRLLHRVGVHRRGGPAKPRPARHGRRRGAGAGHAAVLVRFDVQPGRTARPWGR